MCLNENAVTTSSILEYFKEKNPEWKDVKSVVIDKDFVEWQVLEQTFPNAQIVYVSVSCYNLLEKGGET
ncbi:hypothetical protein F444_16214 [Phytophthora nicotianae P1976]|uniref:ZSWIM1/3 RNaseH-like domain-containing protein n=1 Tax=Phytophthora nicotianae P1976 TaxID=1317066 RepID=A0A080ZJ85_PHYNI|nr:hypothetical protein F444_16214 [Phytophthora nicotianae P1976]